MWRNTKLMEIRQAWSSSDQDLAAGGPPDSAKPQAWAKADQRFDNSIPALIFDPDFINGTSSLGRPGKRNVWSLRELIFPSAIHRCMSFIPFAASVNCQRVKPGAFFIQKCCKCHHVDLKDNENEWTIWNLTNLWWTDTRLHRGPGTPRTHFCTPDNVHFNPV